MSREEWRRPGGSRAACGVGWVPQGEESPTPLLRQRRSRRQPVFGQIRPSKRPRGAVEGYGQTDQWRPSGKQGDIASRGTGFVPSVPAILLRSTRSANGEVSKSMRITVRSNSTMPHLALRVGHQLDPMVVPRRCRPEPRDVPVDGRRHVSDRQECRYAARAVPTIERSSNRSRA